MDAADTAVVHLRLIGGTKVVTITGATANGFRAPTFYGNLVC